MGMEIIRHFKINLFIDSNKFSEDKTFTLAEHETPAEVVKEFLDYLREYVPDLAGIPNRKKYIVFVAYGNEGYSSPSNPDYESNDLNNAKQWAYDSVYDDWEIIDRDTWEIVG